MIFVQIQPSFTSLWNALDPGTSRGGSTFRGEECIVSTLLKFNEDGCYFFLFLITTVHLHPEIKFGLGSDSDKALR